MKYEVTMRVLKLHGQCFLSTQWNTPPRDLIPLPQLDIAIDFFLLAPGKGYAVGESEQLYLRSLYLVAQKTKLEQMPWN